MTRLLAALRSLLYAGVFVSLWWWVVVSVRPFDEQITIALAEWLQIPGLALIVGGAAQVLWCLVAFSWEGMGTPAPFDAPREVVMTGPYPYVRNPMYLGAMLIILGTGFMLRRDVSRRERTAPVGPSEHHPAVVIGPPALEACLGWSHRVRYPAAWPC